jgi:hypothetical protein
MTFQTKSLRDSKPQSDSIPRRRSFSGGDLFALVVMPDGTGFFCVPVDDEMAATRLSRDEMIKKLIEVYGSGTDLSNSCSV